MTEKEVIEQVKNLLNDRPMLDGECLTCNRLYLIIKKALALLEQVDLEQLAPQGAEPPAGEFTKRIRKILDRAPLYTVAWLVEHLREACDRLDAHQQEIEKLKTENAKMDREKRELDQEARELLDCQVHEGRWPDPRIQKLEAALERIQTWAGAYPLDIFPKPDFVKVAEVLKAAGLNLDAISAYNMRHVLEGVKDICEQALKDEKEGD